MELSVSKLIPISSREYKLIPFYMKAPGKPSSFNKETLQDDIENERHMQEVTKNTENPSIIDMLKDYRDAQVYFGSTNKKLYESFFNSLSKNSSSIKLFTFDKVNKSLFLNEKRFWKAKKLLQFLFSNKTRLSLIDQLPAFLKMCKLLPKSSIAILKPQIRNLINDM